MPNTALSFVLPTRCPGCDTTPPAWIVTVTPRPEDTRIQSFVRMCGSCRMKLRFFVEEATEAAEA